MKTPKILVLGGGFAGVEVAIKLRQYGYEVTLVSNRDYLFIYPISIWIPVGKKRFDQVQLSLKKLQQKHGFKLIIDEVEQLNPKDKQVKLQNQTVSYDYLFIALGMSKVSSQGIEHVHSICGAPQEAVTIRDLLQKIIQKGRGEISIGFGGNPADPTATAIRGGPAFELLFNISYYIKQLGLRDTITINFFAPMKEPGKKLGDKPYARLADFYNRYHIQVHVGKKIKQFEDRKIVFEDESVLKSDLTIFISGGAGHPVFVDSGLPLNNAGFLKIESSCQVVGYPDIFAIGDSAEIVGPDWVAKQGHIAEVMADVGAYNLNNMLSGKETKKSYQDKLSIICIMDSGDGAAIISRTIKGGRILLLPILGHWLKKAWGFYYIHSKLKNIPRIPGM